MTDEQITNQPAPQPQSPPQEAKPAASSAEITNALNQTGHEELSERPSLEYLINSPKK